MPPFVTRDNTTPRSIARTAGRLTGWLTRWSRGAVLSGSLCLVIVAGCTPAENLALSQRIHGPDKLVVSRNENIRIVDQFGGAYDDPPLQQYANDIGRELHRINELWGDPPHIFILNSPVVTLMSTPGNQIFISRGLLSLLNSEAELASLIAMEMAQISSGASGRRWTNSQRTLGAAVLDELVPGTDLARLIAYADAPYLTGYSMRNSARADRRAVRYLVKAGYDPAAMIDIVRTIQVDSALGARVIETIGGVDPFHFQNLHPRSTSTVAAEISRSIPLPSTATRLGRSDYLNLINGMAIGDDPRLGFVRGRRYINSYDGLSLTVPVGFRLLSGQGIVTARGPAGSLIVADITPPSPGVPLEYYLNTVFLRGVKSRPSEAVSVGGMRGLITRARMPSSLGYVELHIGLVQLDNDRLMRVVLLTPSATSETVAFSMREMIEGIHIPREEEIQDLDAYRLVVRDAGNSASIEQIASTLPYGNLNIERFMLMNGLLPGDRLIPGQKIKFVESIR